MRDVIQFWFVRHTLCKSTTLRFSTGTASLRSPLGERWVVAGLGTPRRWVGRRVVDGDKWSEKGHDVFETVHMGWHELAPVLVAARWDQK